MELLLEKLTIDDSEKMGYRQTGEEKQIQEGMDIVFYRKNLVD